MMSAPEHVPSNTRLARVLSMVLATSPTLLSVAPLAVLPMALAGCKNEPTIPGTEIPDNEDNRQIIAVLERYRTSFVSRDAAAMLATAHPTYQDHAGTDDPSDDTTYTELGGLLRRRLSQLDSIRFTIDYLEIQRIEDRAVVRVWIDASYRFKPLLDSYGETRSQSPFARVMDHAEFELVREGDNWLIVRGL
jgi:hypothetical protein